jgi:hypothetical protein
MSQFSFSSSARPSMIIELVSVIPRSTGLDSNFFRGCSSAGRAPDLHSGGRRFDPDQLHQAFGHTAAGFWSAQRFISVVRGSEMGL